MIPLDITLASSMDAASRHLPDMETNRKNMKAYKLTDQNCTTQNNTLWEIGVTKEICGELQDKDAPLCSESWFHVYGDPLLAVLMNPNHANIKHPRLWEAEASGLFKEESLKSGTTCLTLIRELELPVLTTVQRIAFGILCAKSVCTEASWIVWADNWLSGKDRSGKSATYAATYAATAATAATDAASYAASYAIYAADAAAYAATDAAAIDFIALAKQALTIS